MSYSYWIQNSDFSNPTGLSESEPVESARQVMEVISRYDWAKENAYEAACIAKGEDSCPAGIGIVRSAGIILHICPNTESQIAMINLHYPVATKFLGIFNTTGAGLNTYESVPYNLFETIIRAFLKEDYDAITCKLERYEHD